jgi:F420-dependent methylenetetrahydromethanopterin dehydrogenase
MNERIKALVEQARKYADENRPGSFVKYDPEWFVLYNEKFAELIVRECADIADKAEPYKANDLIRKHFGVEE